MVVMEARYVYSEGCIVNHAKCQCRNGFSIYLLVSTLSFCFVCVCMCRSLVATNDHLLQELEESKQRHGLEIAQLNSNYQQLRKTIQIYSK